MKKIVIAFVLLLTACSTKTQQVEGDLYTYDKEAKVMAIEVEDMGLIWLEVPKKINIQKSPSAIGYFIRLTYKGDLYEFKNGEFSGGELVEIIEVFEIELPV